MAEKNSRSDDLICEFCNMNYKKSRMRYLWHHEVCHNYKTYRCPLAKCRGAFKILKNFQSHLRGRHEENEQVINLQCYIEH